MQMLLDEFFRRFRKEIGQTIVLLDERHGLALQLTAGLLVLSEELHGVHVRHVYLVGQQTLPPGRGHVLHIVIRLQSLCTQTEQRGQDGD